MHNPHCQFEQQRIDTSMLSYVRWVTFISDSAAVRPRSLLDIPTNSRRRDLSVRFETLRTWTDFLQASRSLAHSQQQLCRSSSFGRAKSIETSTKHRSKRGRRRLWDLLGVGELRARSSVQLPELQIPNMSGVRDDLDLAPSVDPLPRCCAMDGDPARVGELCDAGMTDTEDLRRLDPCQPRVVEVGDDLDT